MLRENVGDRTEAAGGPALERHAMLANVTPSLFVVPLNFVVAHPTLICRFRSKLQGYSVVFPGGPPPNTLLIISRLADDDYLRKVQTVAAL